MTSYLKYVKIVNMSHSLEFEGAFHKCPWSGYGYEAWFPEHPRSLTEAPAASSPAVFTQVGEVAATLCQIESGGVLVWGEPGAGKSHFRDDLIARYAASQGVPYLSVALHINAGKPEDGPARVADMITTLKGSGRGKKLVFFDNVDFLGYRSNHRTRRGATTYAHRMGSVIHNALQDPMLAVLGTAHDPAWREGGWEWDDDEINGPAQEVLNKFSHNFKLTGELTEFGINDTLRERDIFDEDFATQLARDGLTTFFHVMHLDPAIYFANPSKALQLIADKRQALKQSRRRHQ